MKSLKGLGCLFLFMAMLAPHALAEDIWTMAESDQYGRKAAGMFGRGLLNVVTSPVDIVVQTVEKTKSGPPFVGTMAGLGSGIGCGVVRIGSGVLDVVTFWVPSFNGIAVSKSYSNCLESNTSGNWEGSQYAASNQSYASAQPTSTSWATSSTPSDTSTTWTTSNATTSTNSYVDKSGTNRYVDKSGSAYGTATNTNRYVTK